MKMEFRKYLSSLGMKKAMIEQVEERMLAFDELLNIEIEDIFVTDRIDSGGNRIFDHVFFFADGYIMVAMVGSPDHFHCGSIFKKVSWWRMERTAYDFNRWNERSRLFAFFRTPDVQEEMQASQDNCNKLRDVFKKYIVKNMNDQPGVQTVKQKGTED